LPVRRYHQEKKNESVPFYNTLQTKEKRRRVRLTVREDEKEERNQKRKGKEEK
jgi:hypothetical protein